MLNLIDLWTYDRPVYSFHTFVSVECQEDFVTCPDFYKRIPSHKAGHVACDP